MTKAKNAEPVKLRNPCDYIEPLQCDLDVWEELVGAYAVNGPVISIIAEFREEMTRPLREALHEIAYSRVMDGDSDWSAGWNESLITLRKIALKALR